jgi:hypothetical protein
MSNSDDLMPCPCTMIEQDESCPVGYPSLLCDICNGIGNVAPIDLLARLDALEAEVERLREAERAAWIAGRDAAANECDRLRASYARSADGYDEDDPLRGRIKYSGAAVAVASENIRDLQPPTPEGASHD